MSPKPTMPIREPDNIRLARAALTKGIKSSVLIGIAGTEYTYLKGTRCLFRMLMEAVAPAAGAILRMTPFSTGLPGEYNTMGLSGNARNSCRKTAGLDQAAWT